MIFLFLSVRLLTRNRSDATYNDVTIMIIKANTRTMHSNAWTHLKAPKNTRNTEYERLCSQLVYVYYYMWFCPRPAGYQVSMSS